MRNRNMSKGSGHREESSLRDVRQTLLNRRQELLASVRHEWRDLHVQPTDTSVQPLGGNGERRVLTPETEVAYELMGARAHLLKQVDCALEKVDRGSYGHCEDCDAPIAALRLRALPFAIRCTACQESLERGVMASSARPTQW